MRGLVGLSLGAKRATNGEDDVPLSVVVVDVEEKRESPWSDKVGGRFDDEVVKRCRIDRSDVEVEDGRSRRRVLHEQRHQPLRVVDVVNVPRRAGEPSQSPSGEEGEGEGDSGGDDGAEAVRERKELGTTWLANLSLFQRQETHQGDGQVANSADERGNHKVDRRVGSKATSERHEEIQKANKTLDTEHEGCNLLASVSKTTTGEWGINAPDRQSTLRDESTWFHA